MSESLIRSGGDVGQSLSCEKWGTLKIFLLVAIPGSIVKEFGRIRFSNSKGGHCEAFAEVTWLKFVFVKNKCDCCHSSRWTEPSISLFPVLG